MTLQLIAMSDPSAGASAPAYLSTARNVLCQQGGHIGIGASGKDLFFILHAFIILAALSKAGDGLQPMILRPAVWSPLTFPNEVGDLADCVIGAVIQCGHFRSS
jgi:hypothetical protein